MFGTVWLKRLRGEEPGYGGALEASVVRLDLETELEAFADRTLAALVVTCLVTTVVGLAMDEAVLWGLPLVLLAAGLALVLRRHVDASYLLDNVNRRIDAFTHVLGANHRHTVCRFDEVEAVGVQAERKGAGPAGYVVFLALADGRAYRLSDPSAREDVARARARELARHLDVGVIL